MGKICFKGQPGYRPDGVNEVEIDLNKSVLSYFSLLKNWSIKDLK